MRSVLHRCHGHCKAIVSDDQTKIRAHDLTQYKCFAKQQFLLQPENMDNFFYDRTPDF